MRLKDKYELFDIGEVRTLLKAEVMNFTMQYTALKRDLDFDATVPSKEEGPLMDQLEIAIDFTNFAERHIDTMTRDEIVTSIEVIVSLKDRLIDMSLALVQKALGVSKIPGLEKLQPQTGLYGVSGRKKFEYDRDLIHTGESAIAEMQRELGVPVDTNISDAEKVLLDADVSSKYLRDKSEVFAGVGIGDDLVSKLENQAEALRAAIDAGEEEYIALEQRATQDILDEIVSHTTGWPPVPPRKTMLN